MRTLGKRSVKHYIRDRQRKGKRVNPLQIASCYGKIRYEKHSARERAKGVPEIRAYKCRFCGHWHVGGKD